MNELKRLEKRHNFLLNFLLGNKYEVKDSLEYRNWLWRAIHLLEPIHRDDMIAHYFENRIRTKPRAQNIFHGRYALAAVLRSNTEVTLDQLKELCHEKDTSI